MEIPDSYIIHDTRTSKDFKQVTICGYKRKDVLNAFQNSIINNKLEDSIRWCVELHSTGLNQQIWNSLKNIYFKYIHINNPKLFFYLLKREKDYQHCINKYPKKHEIFTRNNQEIRNLYAELIAIFTLTKKNNLFFNKSLPTINNKSFLKEEIHKRMISKNLDKIMDFVYNSTKNYERLALNEIINNLENSKGTFQNCIYWYLWLEKMDNSKKKENNIIFLNIIVKDNENKYFDHWIFILWNIINKFKDNLDKNNSIFLKKLHHIYTKNFKLSDINKKRYYIFCAFYIFFNNVNWNMLLPNQEYLIIQSNANINKMYENIIKNIECNLSDESKKILYKNYNKLFIDIFNKKTVIKKIRDTNLNTEINKVLFTNYPEYSKELKNEEIKNDLISTNMTTNDIEEQKYEIKNKKLNAFSQFITYKKEAKEEPFKQKNVLDYYINEPENNIIKNINFSKKKLSNG